jgi:hypothetical protein
LEASSYPYEEHSRQNRTDRSQEMINLHNLVVFLHRGPYIIDYFRVFLCLAGRSSGVIDLVVANKNLLKEPQSSIMVPLQPVELN